MPKEALEYDEEWLAHANKIDFLSLFDNFMGETVKRRLQRTDFYIV